MNYGPMNLRRRSFCLWVKKMQILCKLDDILKINYESANSENVLQVKVTYSNRLRPFLNKTHAKNIKKLPNNLS